MKPTYVPLLCGLLDGGSQPIYLQICISSIYAISQDVHKSILHAADSIGLKDTPSYEVVMGYHSDWIKETQVRLILLHFVLQLHAQQMYYFFFPVFQLHDISWSSKLFITSL